MSQVYNVVQILPIAVTNFVGDSVRVCYVAIVLPFYKVSHVTLQSRGFHIFVSGSPLDRTLDTTIVRVNDKGTRMTNQ